MIPQHLRTLSQTIFIGVAFFLGACASTKDRKPQALIKIPVSGPRFDVPESTGGWGHGRIDGSVQGGHRLNYDLASETLSPEISPITNIALGGALGIGKRIDLEIELWNLAKVKFQVLGENQQNSHEGNFSLALIAAGGVGGQNGIVRTTNYHGEGPVGTYESIKIEEVGILEGALSAGYRYDERLLAYTTPFITYREFVGSYDSDLSANVNTVKRRGTITTYGLSLGFEYRHERFRLGVEFTGLKTHSVQRVDRVDAVAGAQMGVVF